jgi:hypothetical protein
MNTNDLIVASSVFVFVGYVPELFILVRSIFTGAPYQEINSLLIWVLWITSSFLGVAYAYQIGNNYLLLNFALTGSLNVSVFLLRYVYFGFLIHSSREKEKGIQQEVPKEVQKEDPKEDELTYGIEITDPHVSCVSAFP